MSVIRFAAAAVTTTCMDAGRLECTDRVVRGVQTVGGQWGGSARGSSLGSQLRKRKLRLLEAADSGGVLQRSASVGGPRWILRDGVLCSNREMFYAEATVAAERME